MSRQPPPDNPEDQPQGGEQSSTPPPGPEQPGGYQQPQPGFMPPGGHQQPEQSYGYPPGAQPPPGSPPYAQGYAPMNPPPKRRRSRLLFGTIVAIVALVCVGFGISSAIGGGGGGGPTTTEEQAGGDTEGEKAGKIGTPIRDGKFEFVVKDVQCGVNEVGDDYLGESAQGQFCLVNLSVKNISDEAQMFSDTDQKAVGTTGKEYNADTEAGPLANEDPEVFSTEINPGNTLDSVVVFDIPEDAELASVELHDSPASGGAKVNV